MFRRNPPTRQRTRQAVVPGRMPTRRLNEGRQRPKGERLHAPQGRSPGPVTVKGGREQDAFADPVTGDRVLRMVGQTIANALRRGDLPIRWGGEEFIAWMSGRTRPVLSEPRNASGCWSSTRGSRMVTVKSASPSSWARRWPSRGIWRDSKSSVNPHSWDHRPGWNAQSEKELCPPIGVVGRGRCGGLVPIFVVEQTNCEPGCLAQWDAKGMP